MMAVLLFLVVLLLPQPGAAQSLVPRVHATLADEAVQVTDVLVEAARSVVGSRYRMGGESARRGFDCSGLVRYIYRRVDIELPRTSAEMARSGRGLSREISTLAPGDLLFFATKGRRIDHVAMYVGGDSVIHATIKGGGVRFDRIHSLRGAWFTRRWVGARRVLPDDTVGVPQQLSPGYDLFDELDGKPSSGSGSDLNVQILP